MPSTAGETFYDLALRSLEEQEREVDSLRTRTGTLAAAAAIAGTVLTEASFAHQSPTGALDWATTGAGLTALVIVLLGSVYLLWSHNLVFSVDAGAALDEVSRSQALGSADLGVLHLALTDSVSAMQAHNLEILHKLRMVFSLVSSALVVETLGLGVGTAL